MKPSTPYRSPPGTKMRRRSGGASTFRSGSKKSKASTAQDLFSLFRSDRVRFAVLVAFMLLVAFCGGSSRTDIPALVILAPASLLAVTYAALHLTIEQVRIVRGPLIFVSALILWALLQLLPLPEAVWRSLPYRDVIASTSGYIGAETAIRPLTMAPGRTWGSVFGLFIPLAAISLVAIQSDRYRSLVVQVLAAIALVSAALAILQAIGLRGLRLYQISHEEFPVGLFANRNHQAVLLLWLMLAGSWLAASPPARSGSSKIVLGGAIGLLVTLFPLLLLTGSRTGLALSAPVILISGWLILRSPSVQKFSSRAAVRQKLLPIVAGLAVAVVLLVTFYALAASDRQTGLARLFAADAAEDLRFAYLPVLLKMVRDHILFGVGFGAFESSFNIYEPASMLSSRYMNQAHNDVLQIVMEGGIPAIMIFLCGIIWVALVCGRLWRSGERHGVVAAIFLGSSVVLWVGASVTDYPLRTPLAAMLLAALTARLCFLSTPTRSRRDVPGHEA